MRYWTHTLKDVPHISCGLTVTIEKPSLVVGCSKRQKVRVFHESQSVYD